MRTRILIRLAAIVSALTGATAGFGADEPLNAPAPLLQTATGSELPPSDYPWYWFLQGAYVDLFSPNEVSRANDFYTRAENAAPNELARARFKLAGEEGRLRRSAGPTREALKTMKDNADRFQ